MRRPDVTVHIEELVLHGFDAADRQRIGDAVQRELARLLAERGLGSATLAARPFASTGNVTLRRDAPARAVGSNVARAVFGVLRR